MPNMWNYFLGAMDKGMPYATQAESFRQNDVAMGIQQQNADTARADQELRRDEWDDQLFDFDAARKGYQGPLSDEMEMIYRGVGGRKTNYQKIVPWIQPETMRDMSGRAERMQERMLSEQAKTLAKQMEAMKSFGAALSKLRGPQAETIPGPYPVAGSSTMEGIRSTALPIGPVPGVMSTGLFDLALKGLGAIFPSMMAPGEITQGTPGMVNRDVIPDGSGLSPAQQAALLSGGSYGELQDLLSRGIMGNEQNLGAAYTPTQYVLNDPGRGLVGADPSTNPLLQMMEVVSSSMMPQDVSRSQAARQLAILKALQAQELEDKKTEGKLKVSAAKK